MSRTLLELSPNQGENFALGDIRTNSVFVKHAYQATGSFVSGAKRLTYEGCWRSGLDRADFSLQLAASPFPGRQSISGH